MVTRFTKTIRFAALACAALLLAAAPAAAQKQQAHPKKDPKEIDEYYKIHTLPIPEDINLEVGGLEVMPDGRIAVGTRHGDIYMVEGAMENPPKDVKFTRWATGLHESLGLAYNPKDGFLYAVQRPEITRLKDTDNDGRADVYETFCDEWAVSGDYHEYPFMSRFDKDGNLYAVLCLTGSFDSKVPWRGWCVQVTPEGKMLPYASGIRSPGGIGFDAKGNLFYTDNQGPWNGTSSLKHITKGSFQGHPDGNKWYDHPLAKATMGKRPATPKSKSRIYVERETVPEMVPPPVWLPHGIIGQSASGILFDASGGKFGPFAGQLFVGDQHHSNIVRCVLEEVNGKLQGAAIPFRWGFASGVLPMTQAPDGSFIVGGTNRGWGSMGPKEFALERLVWTGKTPFEIHDVKIQPDGFTLTFTQPVDKAAAADAAGYKLKAWSYIYQSDYGSPEVDHSTPAVKSVTVGDDGRSVRLAVDGLKIGSVHQIDAPGVRAADGGKPLLHPVAYYTLWNLPTAGK